MKTNREIMKGFQEQWHSGRLFTEAQVLVLMGHARSEGKKEAEGETDNNNPLLQCPYTKTACINLDTSGCTPLCDCSECPNNELNSDAPFETDHEYYD